MSPSEWPAGRLGALLMLAMFSSTFAIAGLSALGPTLTRAFDLTSTQFGALASVVFGTAAVCSPMAGRYVDRIEEGTALFVLFSIGAISMAVAAASPSYVLLLAAMGLAGIAMGAGNPATNRILARRRPSAGRGWLVGVKQAGQPLTMLLAGAILPAIAAIVNWRVAISVGLALSMVGLAWVILSVRSSGESMQGHRPRASIPTDGRMSLLAISAYSFFMGAAMSGTVAYLPIYAHLELGVGPTAAGTLTATIGVLGLASRIGLGRLASIPGVGFWPLVAVAIGGAVSMAIVISSSTSARWPVWIGAALFGATGHSWSAAGTVALLRMFPENAVGRASGVMHLTFFVGLAGSPVLVGTVRDASGHFTPAWVLIAAMYLLAAGVALGHFMRPSYRKQAQRLANVPATPGDDVEHGRRTAAAGRNRHSRNASPR